MSDAGSFREDCLWISTWIYYKDLNCWNQEGRQLWEDCWLWHSADNLGLHLDLITLTGIAGMPEETLLRMEGDEPPKICNPEGPVLLWGILYWVLVEEGKVCVLIVRKLLGLIDRSLERVRRSRGAMSEAPAVMRAIRSVRVTSL